MPIPQDQSGPITDQMRGVNALCANAGTIVWTQVAQVVSQGKCIFSVRTTHIHLETATHEAPWPDPNGMEPDRAPDGPQQRAHAAMPTATRPRDRHYSTALAVHAGVRGLGMKQALLIDAGLLVLFTAPLFAWGNSGSFSG